MNRRQESGIRSQGPGVRSQQGGVGEWGMWVSRFHLTSTFTLLGAGNPL